MRKVVFVVAAVASLVFCSTAFALVSEEKDVPVTDNNGAVASGKVSLQTADGKTIATADIKNGKAHLKVDEKDITPKTKVVVKIHVDADPKTGKPASDKEKRDEAIGLFLDKGLNVDTLGPAVAATAASNLHQIGLAVHHHPAVTEHPATVPQTLTAPLRMEDVTFLEFGVVAGNSWMKTDANDFGTGLGGSTFFSHTNSSPFVGINAGMSFPVFSGVSIGPVFQLLSGDLNSTTVIHTTPSGIVGNAQLSRGVSFDAMGRVYVALPWTVSLFGQGGVEVAKFTGSMVNNGVETFQVTTTITSPIAGGGITFPLCGPLAIQNNGICPLQAVVEFDHVFDNKTFFTGMTPASSATATVNGENRVMAGLNFTSVTSNLPIFVAPPPAGSTPIFSDIRLKHDIAEVGRLDNGLGLYRYRYWWSDQVYVGVMAQEVAQVVPDAVTMAPEGYLRVDYARLGTRLQTYDEWVAAGRPHAVN